MIWTRPATAGAVAILVMLLLAAIAVPATAASDKGRGRSTPPGHAKFEGRHIDLTTGWGDARTCVVWTHDGETECFRTDAEAEDAMAAKDRGGASASTASWSLAAVSTRWLGLDPSSPLTDPWTTLLTSSCGDWLTLYEHTGFSGRSLRFRDRGYYQDLANWGFAGATSSYRVGSCGVALRDGGWTAYPGWTGAGASASSMASGWNDRVRYLRIS